MRALPHGTGSRHRARSTGWAGSASVRQRRNETGRRDVPALPVWNHTCIRWAGEDRSGPSGRTAGSAQQAQAPTAGRAVMPASARDMGRIVQKYQRILVMPASAQDMDVQMIHPLSSDRTVTGLRSAGRHSPRGGPEEYRAAPERAERAGFRPGGWPFRRCPTALRGGPARPARLPAAIHDARASPGYGTTGRPFPRPVWPGRPAWRQ